MVRRKTVMRKSTWSDPSRTARHALRLKSEPMLANGVAALCRDKRTGNPGYNRALCWQTYTLGAVVELRKFPRERLRNTERKPQGSSVS
jgi:hypothetical protein